MNEEILQGTTGDPLDEQEATAELEQQDLTPDEAAAALSFATNLQERFTEQEAMMAGVQGEEGSEEAPQGEETEEVVEEPVVEEEAVEIDKEAIKEEIKAEILEELSSALAEEDDKEDE